MSRKFAMLAAALAFWSFTAVAHAAGDGASRPPGYRGADQSLQGDTTTPTTTGDLGAASGRWSGSGDSRRAAPRQATRQPQMSSRADRRGTSGSDGAYMGGGAVYERTPDGSLRPMR
jgi:hypothetical protein